MIGDRDQQTVPEQSEITNAGMLMGPRNILIALLSGTAIAAGLAFALLRGGEPAKPGTATMLPVANEVPAFELVDETGRAIDASVFEGRWDLLFFGFTHCPDICPLTLQKLHQAREQLADAGREPLPRIVFVSVDPERDTPEVVSRYIGHFGEDTLGITGDVEELRKLTDGLGIFFARAPADGDDYAVDHSAVVLVIDPDGRFRALFSAPHHVEHFVDDLPLIMAAR